MYPYSCYSLSVYIVLQRTIKQLKIYTTEVIVLLKLKIFSSHNRLVLMVMPQGIIKVNTRLFYEWEIYKNGRRTENKTKQNFARGKKVRRKPILTVP